MKELLYLQSRYPGSILTNTFEISDDGQHIGCATLPYLPLSCQLDGSSEVFNPKDPQLIQKLISDALYDIEFLWKNMQMRKVMNVLGPESLCFMKEKEAFFLSDWSKLFETGSDDLSRSVAPTTTTSLKGKKLTSQEIVGEIKAVASAMLKLNKIELKELEGLGQMKDVGPKLYDSAIKSALQECFSNSSKMQALIERMLSSDPQSLPNLEELRIKDVGYQAPVKIVAEESKQIKEPGTQFSSQPKIKEVKQAPGKRVQAALPQRNIITTSKLIFKAKQAHLPKLSNVR